MFINKLPDSVEQFAPKANADAIVHGGSASQYAPVDEDFGILEAYNAAVTETFYLVVAASFVAVLTAFGMGWGTVKKGQPEGKEEGKGMA
jgi:hypothetical protein